MAVFSQDCSAYSWSKRISSDPQRFLARARVVSQWSEGAQQVRLFGLAQAVHFDSQTDCWISMRCLPGVSVENNDRWGCRNRQVTLIMFMSGVLQHCRSFGLSRFRLHRIGSQNTVLVGSVDVLVQDRETGFAARGVLLAICCGSSRGRRTHAVPGSETRSQSRLSNTRTGVGGCSQVLGFSSAGGVLLRREHGSASRVAGAHGNAAGLFALLLLSGEWCAKSCANESFRRRAKLMELWSATC